MKNRKNNKKQNKTKSVLGGIGLVVLASALTLGGVHLFNNKADNEKIELTKLISVNMNTLANKATITNRVVSSSDYKVEDIVYEEDKLDYKLSITNYLVSPSTASSSGKSLIECYHFNQYGCSYISLTTSIDDIYLINVNGYLDGESVSISNELMKSSMSDGFYYSCGSVLFLEGKIDKITSFDFYGIEHEPSSTSSSTSSASSTSSSAE